MKNLFLALLLANILFLGWRLWIAPSEVPAEKLAKQGPEPQLAAVVRNVDAKKADAAADAVPADAAEQRCLRVGPIAEGGLADTLRGSLAARGIGVVLTSEEGQIWVGHWVQLESVASRQEADAVAARLAAGGLPDAYVLQNSPPFSVSLGVFRDRERADAVVAQARKLGFRPQVTDRYRAGLQFWLNLTIPAGMAITTDEIGRQAGQIVRTEQVDCAGGSIGAAAASD